MTDIRMMQTLDRIFDNCGGKQIWIFDHFSKTIGLVFWIWKKIQIVEPRSTHGSFSFLFFFFSPQIINISMNKLSWNHKFSPDGLSDAYHENILMTAWNFSHYFKGTCPSLLRVSLTRVTKCKFCRKYFKLRENYKTVR